jgi:pyruvate,water dikinase
MADDNGTVEAVVSDTERQRFCLDDDALRRLLALGDRVEAYYGKPQDIEWGLANGQLYLLQTRPITSLAVGAPQPQTLSRTQHAIVNDLLEHFPEPPYLLDYLAVTDSYQQLADAISEYGISLPPSTEIILLGENGIPSVVPPSPRLNAHVFKMPGTLRKNLQTDPSLWINQQHASFVFELEALRKTDVTQLDNRELAMFIQNAVRITSRVGAIRFRDFIIPAVARSAYLQLLMRFAKDSASINVMDLLGDLPYKTAVIDHELHQLALEAGKLPQASEILLNTPMDSVIAALEQNAEGKVFLEKVNAFLNEHGARTMKMYLPFSNRSWSETPATLLTTIAVLLRSNKSRPEFHEHYKAVHQRLVGRQPGWLRKKFVTTLERFRSGHVARESTLYTIEEGFLQARRGVDEAAQRLVAGGALPGQEKAIYLTLTELYAALEGSRSLLEIPQLVARREKARTQATKAWRGQWQTAQKSTSNAAVMKGLSGSAGYAEGIAKVIHGPAEFDKLQPGDVLVCTYTDPAWTPLFTLACAVVSDTGGPLSHAAIVAREYGIPAVLGTQNATAQFKDGDRLSVDGQSGEVRLVRKE